MKKGYFSSPLGMLELVSNEAQICELNFIKSSLPNELKYSQFGKNSKNDYAYKEIWQSKSDKYGWQRNNSCQKIFKTCSKSSNQFNSKNDAILTLALNELELYFAGKLKNFSVPVCISGSAFEQEIYQTLLKIPYGKTITYGELAANIGRPKAYRAAGNANGKNKIPIIIPCHRVVGTNSLGGYSGAGGIETKKFLLTLEGAKF